MSGQFPGRVVIVSDFSAVSGGASKLAMLQAELLNALGIPVTVFTGDAGAPLPAGIELVALGGRKLLEQGRVAAAVGGLWSRLARQNLSDWIGRNDTPDTIYHVHGYHQTLSPSVLAPLVPVQGRTVMHAHDYFLTCPNGTFFDFRAGQSCGYRAMSTSCVLRNCDKRSYGHKLWRVVRQGVQNRTRRRLLPGVTTVLIHAGMAARLFPDDPVGPVVTIANPADPLLSRPVSAAGNRDFVFVGDIHAYKGVFLLAEAGLRAGVPIRFVGDGQDRAKLQAQFPKHRFDGWQDCGGLARIMAKARVLVAPTLGPEPYGLAPVEALLSGVPVLVSDSMLLSRDIRRGEFGQCFAAGNCESLTRALGSLALDDAKVARMARNAQAGGNDLSLSSNGWRDALLEVYDRILAGGRADREVA